MQINTRACALAGGVLWAGALFFLALTAQWWGWGDTWVQVLSDLYLGYAPGFVGGIIGAVWGFFDLLIGCALFARLYNMFAKKMK